MLILQNQGFVDSSIGANKLGWESGSFDGVTHTWATSVWELGWYGGGDRNWSAHPTDPKVAPIDAMDALFQAHDLVYYYAKINSSDSTAYNSAISAADAQLVGGLASLPGNPSQWNATWNTSNSFYSNSALAYRVMAFELFGKKLGWW